MKLADPGIARVASVTIRNSAASTGRAHRQAAEPRQVLGAGALPQQGDDQEDRRHHQAVVDHLEHRAVGAVGSQGEDPDRDEAELGDRGVAGDQAHVGLRERHHRAVEDAGDADHQDQLLEVDRRLRVERQRDPQEAVGADLREHARQQRQHRQRRGAVGVGQPAVDEERRHLDQERGGEEQEDPVLAAGPERVGAQVGEREAQVARPGRRRGSRWRSRRPASAASRPACRRSSSSSPRSGSRLRRCRSGTRTAPASGRRRGRTAAGPGPGRRPARRSRRARA